MCSKGHAWTPENTLYESAGRGTGRKRRRCRACRKDRRIQAIASGARASSPTSNQVRRGRGVPDYGFNAERAKEDFDYALKHIHTPCEGRWDQFTDYELEDAPSPETAQALCQPCVLKDLCLKRAESKDSVDSEWGIWGGKVWVEKIEYRGGTA